MNFAQFLRGSSRLNPSGTVLLHGDRRVDYLALEMGAQRIATILSRHHGIRPGDRVAMLLPNTPEFGFAAFGILWAGAVVYALDPDSDQATLAAALQAAEAKLLIGWHALAETVERVSAALAIDWLLVEPREFSRLLAATPPRAPLVDLAGDAPALLFGAEIAGGASEDDATGGTGGLLIELGHDHLAFQAKQAVAELGLDSGAVLPARSSLADPAVQIRTLHAAVAAGAALQLASTAPAPALDPVREPTCQ